jgi:hypothetical protein
MIYWREMINFSLIRALISNTPGIILRLSYNHNTLLNQQGVLFSGRINLFRIS